MEEAGKAFGFVSSLSFGKDLNLHSWKFIFVVPWILRISTLGSRDAAETAHDGFWSSPRSALLAWRVETL
jgi:hypothetical protein